MTNECHREEHSLRRSDPSQKSKKDVINGEIHRYSFVSGFEALAGQSNKLPG